MLGYPDWLPSPTELDNYYDGVSNEIILWHNYLLIKRPLFYDFNKKIYFTKVVAPQLDTYLTNILSQRGWASRLELKTLREEPERNM